MSNPFLERESFLAFLISLIIIILIEIAQLGSRFVYLKIENQIPACLTGKKKSSSLEDPFNVIKCEFWVHIRSIPYVLKSMLFKVHPDPFNKDCEDELKYRCCQTWRVRVISLFRGDFSADSMRSTALHRTKSVAFR